MKATQALRQLIDSNKLIIAPGIFDGLSALLAKRAGFPVIYASGGAISRSMGYPDIGLLSLTEVTSVLEHIVQVSGLPVIADADTGFGNALNVKRTVQLFERAGVAGLHLEDQTFPKRCGHLDNKSLISAEEMCQKLRVARESLQDKDFLLIARTDAIAVEGFERAIERAKAYQAAGADMIFIEAPQSVEQIERISKEIQGLKLINMFHGGKTPVVPTDRLEALGFNVVIIPSDLQRAAIHAMQSTLDAIRVDGNSQSVADLMASFKERELIVETEKYLAVE